MKKHSNFFGIVFFLHNNNRRPLVGKYPSVNIARCPFYSSSLLTIISLIIMYAFPFSWKELHAVETPHSKPSSFFHMSMQFDKMYVCYKVKTIDGVLCKTLNTYQVFFLLNSFNFLSICLLKKLLFNHILILNSNSTSIFLFLPLDLFLNKNK